MPLYRRVEANAQILEFRCVEFVEDLMYGHLTESSRVSNQQPEAGSRKPKEAP